MQTCIILANGLLKRIDIYASGASHYMYLYLGFLICKTERMILSFLCKMPKRCRARGRCCTSGVLAWMHWYVGHCWGTRETKKNSIAAHCLSSTCWLYGSDSPRLTGKGKEMEGLNQVWDLLLPENVELSSTFGFTQIFRAVVNYPRMLQMQAYLELMLFVLCLA